MLGSRPLWFFALAVLLIVSVDWGMPGRGRADGTVRVVVVPYSVHDASGAELRMADHIEAALSSARVPVISMHEALDRVLAKSRQPVLFESSDLNVLDQVVKEALEHAAFGRSAATQRSVARLINLAERSLESLNRETRTARSVLNACLALVRDALTRHERQTAITEAMRCRRLVPDVSASESLHPASVIGVLAEADDQLRRMRAGRLSVDSVPKSGCAVYVNGRRLGVTPFQLERAAAGEYRVQVECVRGPGRIHLVQLGDEPAALHIDTQFDGALRSDERLSLEYERIPSRRVVIDHAAQLARIAEAEEVVLFELANDRLKLIRVGTQAQQLAVVNLIWSEGAGGRAVDAKLQSALERLFEGQSDEEDKVDDITSVTEPGDGKSTDMIAETSDTSAVAVDVVAAHENQAYRSAAKPPKAREWLPKSSLSSFTMVSIAASSAAVLLSGVAVAMREKEAQELRDSCDDPFMRRESTCRDILDRGQLWKRTAIGSGTVGAALLAVTTALLIRERKVEQSARRAFSTCTLGLHFGVQCQGSF